MYHGPLPLHQPTLNYASRKTELDSGRNLKVYEVRMLDMKTLRKFCIAIPFGLLALNTQAADAIDSMNQGSSWLYVEQDNGLITNVPASETRELIGSVKELRQSLSNEKEQLSNSVEKKKFTSKDTLLTAILPGGMLYASYRMASYENAKNELANVSTQIEELSQDAVWLADITGETRVAMLY
jgi:pyruvate/oxaloacetate carboxyltransferase